MWQWHVVTVHPVVESQLSPRCYLWCYLLVLFPGPWVLESASFLAHGISSEKGFWNVISMCKCSVALQWSVQGILQPKWVVNLICFGTLNPDLSAYSILSHPHDVFLAMNIGTRRVFKPLPFALQCQRGKGKWVSCETARSLRNEDRVCFKVKRLYLPAHCFSSISAEVCALVSK